MIDFDDYRLFDENVHFSHQPKLHAKGHRNWNIVIEKTGLVVFHEGINKREGDILKVANGYKWQIIQALRNQSCK